MSRLKDFFASMTGRIFLILLIGMTLSAAIAWGLAEGRRQGDLRRLDMARAVDRVEDVVVSWRGLPADQRTGFSPSHMRGVEPASPDIKGIGSEPALEQQLASRLPGLAINAERIASASCGIGRSEGGRDGVGQDGRGRDFDGARGQGGGRPDDGRNTVRQRCWLVSVQDGASRLQLVVESQPRPRGRPLFLDPAFLLVLFVTAGLMGLLVARLAALPLKALSDAATSLGDDLTRSPLPVAGSTEVRQAATAFNAMQVRLQRQLAERTHMLAAITHDLQTPVTRLRLRLEKVETPELRERLLGDLAAMQTLIREGLDLARSAEHSEPAMKVDLQSLIDSIVDDAADAGQDVTTGARCDLDVALQPEAMRRVLSNLIDNALKYGGSAEVSCELSDGAAVVRVRDRGPGLADDQLSNVFEPFVRLEDSRSRETGGAGLGLTIARTLAERNGAEITLRNHPDGGAEAVVRFRKA
jgi:signal transduction histidine kinase